MICSLLWFITPRGNKDMPKLLTIAFLPFPGGEAIEPRLAQVFQESGRIKVVERERLRKVLEELQLSTSDLTDLQPQHRIETGRLLSARLLAFGRLMRAEDEGMLSIRLVETETGVVPIWANEPFETPKGLESVVQKVSQYLLQKVRQTYPLQGRITDITPTAIALNLGKQHGILSGMTLHVFGSADPPATNTPVGRLQVTTVDEWGARAQVLQADVPLQRGWQVKEE
jgi:hypothetical protein